LPIRDVEREVSSERKNEGQMPDSRLVRGRNQLAACGEPVF
jgi:hypothetical protein